MTADVVAPALGRVAAGHWTIVPAESTARFRVRDKLVGRATGTIPVRSGSVVLGADGRVDSARMELEVAGIDAIGRVRYRFHDLVQLFGAEQAMRDEPADGVAAAVCRTLATWMALVDAGASKLPRVTLGLGQQVRTRVELDPRLVAETEQDPSGWFKS